MHVQSSDVNGYLDIECPQGCSCLTEHICASRPYLCASSSRLFWASPAGKDGGHLSISYVHIMCLDLSRATPLEEQNSLQCVAAASVAVHEKRLLDCVVTVASV